MYGRVKIPLKIIFFLWQVFNNKLQVAQNLVKKKWKGDVNCFLCGEVESVDHVFFTCHLATLIWSMIREVFNLERYPNSLCDFSSMWILGKGHLPSRLIIFVFAGLAWALWTTRNKMAIEKIIPKSPTDVMYVALSLLQKWSVRLKDEDQDRISQFKDMILCWIRSFKPNPTLLSDVVEM